MSTPMVRMTKAKAIAAAVGNTLGALQTFLAVFVAASGDDAITAEEITPLVTGLVTLGLTVYAVWRVPNKPEAPPEVSTLRSRTY